MTKTIAFAATVFSISFAHGQKHAPLEIPSVINNKFQQQFPNANDVDWETKPRYYKVEFEDNRTNFEHKIHNKRGTMIYSKEEISIENLPKKILHQINRNYPEFKIKDVEKISTTKNTFYTIEIKHLQKKWELSYQSSGTLIRKKND